MEEAQYKIISKPSEGLFKDKGSKFICYLRPVKTREEVSEEINKIKALHPKGRHHCYAFVLGKQYELEMSNDDGEPSGSAGKPILGQLKSHQLTNCMAVVVRYFGGTKLGIPGLINAYKTSTAEAIANTEIIIKDITVQLLIITDYGQMGHLLNSIKRQNIPILHKSFTDQVEILLAFKQQSFTRDLHNLKAVLLGIAPDEYDGSFDPDAYTFTVLEESA